MTRQESVGAKSGRDSRRDIKVKTMRTGETATTTTPATILISERVRSLRI
jgi:hypothetical protein